MLGNLKLFWPWTFTGRLETDRFVYFLHSAFVLEYADSSNQRDIFLHGSFVLRICPVKSVEYAWPQKTFATRANVFSSIFFSSFSARLFLVYVMKSQCSESPKIFQVHCLNWSLLPNWWSIAQRGTTTICSIPRSRLPKGVVNPRNKKTRKNILRATYVLSNLANTIGRLHTGWVPCGQSLPERLQGLRYIVPGPPRGARKSSGLRV